MPRLTDERVRWALIVAVGALLLVALDIWWIATYRHGYPLDVDEAGYTGIGLVDYIGFKAGGLHGWWEAVQTQTPNAPLIPAITSVLLLAKPGILEGFGTLTGFMVLLTFATYGIGERLAGARLGALAALVVATSHGTFIFAREYIFALPTAALLACAMYALLRSERLEVRRWAIACGASLGLMVLARTMAVAFVPGVLVAAAVLALRGGPAAIRARSANLALLIGAGVVVAALWYWRNLQPVLDYLTNYGYGAQSSYYGASHSAVSWARLHGVAERMTFDDLLVPLATLLFVALVALLFVAGRRLVEARDRRKAAFELVTSAPFAVGVVFVSGYAALMSSQNGGDGFTFPLAVLLPPLAVIALRYFKFAVIPAVTLLAVIAVVNIAATSNISNSLSRTRLVQVPGFGELPAVNGVTHAVGAIRVQVPGPTTHFGSTDRGWIEVDEALAGMLLGRTDPYGTPPVTAFASRNRVISSNSVGLASLAKYQTPLAFTQLNAEPDTVKSYLRQLTDPKFGSPTALITMSRNTNDFPPVVTQRYATLAARRVGFRRVRAFTLPDGRELYVWFKK